MNRMRLRIAERLKQSQNAAASLTTFNEIDMSALVSMRKKYKDAVQKEHDVKLGFMSFFARASVLALKEIPAANASIEGEEIVYRDYVDLSVAVATPKGLVTPVVRNAESMGLVDVEREIASLGKKACFFRCSIILKLDWLLMFDTFYRPGMASCLLRTCLGVHSQCMFDSLDRSFSDNTLLLVQTEAYLVRYMGHLLSTSLKLPSSVFLFFTCCLYFLIDFVPKGMHTIKDRPVVVDGQIIIRPIMVVALTYDHRLLDGREAVTFLGKNLTFFYIPSNSTWGWYSES